MWSDFSPLSFAIHDLNTWAGQERSTLEVARRLAARWPVDIYSYSIDGEKPVIPGAARHRRVLPRIRGPMLLKASYYYAATLPALLLAGRRSVVHATGACSLVSSVVQVQFVQRAWRERRRSLPEPLRRPPRASGAGGLKRKLLNQYYDRLLDYHVLFERMAFRPDKTYIAISSVVADELREHYGLEDNVHVIHHGVDPEYFHPVGSDGDVREREKLRTKLGFGPEDFVVGFIGAFERKGLRTLIQAAGRLPATMTRRLRILAVGGGDHPSHLAEAERLGLGSNVVLRPHTPDVAAFYRASDAFVFPTLYEPFGLVILEAMASGLPVAASRIAGASELIRDRENGLIIDDPTDADEIASRLRALLDQGDLRRKIAAAARQTALSRTWDRVASEYERILEPLVEARHR